MFKPFYNLIDVELGFFITTNSYPTRTTNATVHPIAPTYCLLIPKITAAIKDAIIHIGIIYLKTDLTVPPPNTKKPPISNMIIPIINNPRFIPAFV